jgi:Tetratricopeptide repeat
MSQNPRIEELRRRVQSDPTSIAFAALAEEYRRAGRYEEAIEVCRSGLTRHPAYISARVTLGRALLEVNKLDEAASELEQVLKIAPENLTATRTLNEIAARRSADPSAAAEAVPQPEQKSGFEKDLMAGLARVGVPGPESAPVPPPATGHTVPARVELAPARTPIPVATAARPALLPAPVSPPPTVQTVPTKVELAPARTPVPVSTAARPAVLPAPQPAHDGVVERLQNFLNGIRSAKTQRSDRAAR